MTNLQIINTIQTINANADLLKKKLPVKVLFALKKNITKINAAADDYRSTLATLCEQHGVDPADLNSNIKPDLMTEINALLAEENGAVLSKIPEIVLESCDGSTYDALTYEELEALEFMLEEDHTDVH